MKYCIGIDIGGTKCSVVSADIAQITLDPDRDFLTKDVYETNVHDYMEMFDKFCSSIDAVLQSRDGWNRYKLWRPA